MDPRQDFLPVSPPAVSADEIAAGLVQVGLKPGDRVVAHVSLSSMGHVAGGANTVLDVLLNLVGPPGTVLMPAFVPYVNSPGVYDPTHPPAPVTGRVPDQLRRRKGAVQSLHPSHPVVAIGAQAEEVTGGHLQHSPVGIDSPFDRMARLGGQVLLLGVNQRVNTMIHTGEAYARVPYWGQPRPDRPTGLWMLDSTGAKRWIELHEIPGDSYGFVKVEPLLASRRLIRYGRIGRAQVRLMPGQALIETVADLLEAAPDALLCDRPECFFCNWAREILDRTPEK